MKKGKLYVVEGATGSGKDFLLKHLAHRKFATLRGIPSQNTTHNRSLTPRAKKIIGDTVLNYKKIVLLPDKQRVEIIEKYIKASKIQLREALRLKRKGEIVFLNRSLISVIAHLEMAPYVVPAKLRKELLEFSRRMLESTSFHYKDFLKNLDGIVLMIKPLVKRIGMAGVENLESRMIKKLISKELKNNRKPLLKLDASRLSGQEELRLVEKFLNLND